jgi:hypothetical protein
MMKAMASALLAVFGVWMMALCVATCGCAGPSRARYKVLLHQCREQNRERGRILQEAAVRCPYLPEQLHGATDFGEAGF